MKVSDKLRKVDINYTINQYDNGFMVEVSGQDESEDWQTARINCENVDQLVDLIKEISAMERT